MSHVCLMTCSALTERIGTVLRRALYKVVEELRPEKTVLGCLPATNRGVAEDIEFITDYPTIAVEGCSRFCVSKVLNKKGFNPCLILNAEEFLRRNGIDLSSARPEKLDAQGEAAVEFLAVKLSEFVDLLLGDKEER